MHATTSARPARALVLALAALSLSGCATPAGPRRLDTATASVAETNRLLLEGRDEVERVVTAMNALAPSADLPSGFRRFSSAIDNLERMADRVRARNAAMTARARDHLRAWERELLEISGDAAREIGQQRRAAFAADFAALQQKMDALSTAFDPFMSDLHDLRLVMANDLTAGGLSVAAPLMKDANSRAEAVKKAIEEASAALVATEAEINPRTTR
jgi:hypothetical protein